MVRLFHSLCLLGLVAAVSAQPDPNEIQDATCDFFTDKCNSDNPACMCTLNDMRDDYFCCLAKNCAPNVLPASILRQTADCNAWNIPIPAFDVQAVCGIKLAGTSTSTSAMITIFPSAPTSSLESIPTTRPASGTVVSQTPASSSALPTSSNGTAVASTTKSPGNATTSTGAATTTNPVPGSGSHIIVQGAPVALGLVALFAAML